MLSQPIKQFLKKQLNILPKNFEKWTNQQLSRFLALLKLPQNIQKQFYEQCLNINLTKGLEDLIDKFSTKINSTNYFPYQKLKCTLNIIINLNQDESTQCNLLVKNFSEIGSEITISQPIVLSLIENLDKMQDIEIIELTSIQIYNITKNCGLNQHAKIVKKYNVDGFNLICSLSDIDVLKDTRNYFTDQDIAKLLELNYLYMAQYFRKSFINKKKNISNTTFRKKNNTIDADQLEHQKRQVKQFVIQSNQMIKKFSEDDIQIYPLQTQQCSQQIIGNSEVGQTQYATSDKGSVYARSEYALSVRGSVDCRMSYRYPNSDGRASMMYDSQIITQLRDACLSLPFDLLNLQQLQQIKIRPLKSAFGKQQQKQSYLFSVQGAKLGRDKENDIRFPDQLSISGKHAQIIFKSEMFYLQDLGSKMGTYLRIIKNIVIEEGTCIQFSTDIEIVFRILKKVSKQGIIKVEIKKPQNLPDYKITLKEGFKFKVGKSDLCHVKINNPALADKHAQIYYKDLNFFFKNCHSSYISWLRLSPKSMRSDTFKLSVGEIFRLSSKKVFLVENIVNELLKK